MFKDTLLSIYKNAKTSVNAFLDVKNMKQAIAIAPFALMSSSAFADFSKASNLINQINSWLTGISVTVITMAILVAGYKILFQGQTFREVAPILIGGVIIGGAAQIATLFAA